MQDWQNRITRYGTQAADQFLANPLNPRRHPQPQRDAVKGSLDTLGWIAPVIVNKRTGYMIDGHERVMQALGQGDDTPVPFIEVDLSEDEERLALASFDWITQMAVYDRDSLDTLLQQVNTDDAALQSLLSELAESQGIVSFDETPQEAPEAQIDRAEELQQKWQVKRGDVWLIGKHRIMCGDSTSADDVARLMGGARVNIVINDPPYGMRLDADFSEMKSGLKFAADKSAFGGKRYDNVIGDHEDYDASPLVALFESVKEHFWFGADYYSSTLGDTMHTGAWLVWDKRLDESADLMYGSCFELIWSKQKHKRDILRHKWAGIFGVEQEPEKLRFHPNQKPTPLIRDILERYSSIGDIAIDCYAGSGTTLVACQQTGRIGYGMELAEKYVAVALERLSQMGLTPQLESQE